MWHLSQIRISPKHLSSLPFSLFIKDKPFIILKLNLLNAKISFLDFSIRCHVDILSSPRRLNSYRRKSRSYFTDLFVTIRTRPVSSASKKVGLHYFRLYNVEYPYGRSAEKLIFIEIDGWVIKSEIDKNHIDGILNIP